MPPPRPAPLPQPFLTTWAAECFGHLAGRGCDGSSWGGRGGLERARQGSQQMPEAHMFPLRAAGYRSIQRPPPDRRSHISAGR